MNNIEKQKKILNIIRNIYFSYCILIFLISILQKHSIINLNFSLMPIYGISMFIIIIIIVVLFIKVEKIKYIDKMYSIIITSIIGLVAVIFFAILIDSRTSSIEFSKHSTKIDAIIYDDIEKEVKFHKDNCPAGYSRVADRCYSINDKNDYKSANDYYEVYYTYHLKYNVDNRIYENTYEEKNYKKFSNENNALNYKVKYNKGDSLTIYYDNNNPQIIKKYVSTSYGIGTYIAGIIAIVLELLFYIKYNKFIKGVVK